jgi:hypothetical protein
MAENSHNNSAIPSGDVLGAEAMNPAIPSEDVLGDEAIMLEEAVHFREKDVVSEWLNQLAASGVTQSAMDHLICDLSKTVNTTASTVYKLYTCSFHC